MRYITDDLKLFPHDSNENNFHLINAQKSLFPLSLSFIFSSSRRDLPCNTNQSLQIKILTGKILATVENSHNKRRLFHQAKNSRKRRKIKKTISIHKIISTFYQANLHFLGKLSLSSYSYSYNNWKIG